MATNKTDALHEGLLKMINYLPQIYTQRETGKLGEIIIKYPYKTIPNNSLLFVIPLKGSEVDDNTLSIRFGVPSTDGSTITYTTTKTYKILIEDTDGMKRDATSGDILPDRLCIFRFIRSNSDSVVLCNSPIYGDIYCSNLTVTNAISFSQIPKVNGVALATEAKVLKLEDEIKALKNKIKFGTETAEEYFENNEADEGTIYLQVEE